VGKRRIDIVLVERGFFETREKAQRALMAGEVFVGTRRIAKAAQTLSPDEEDAIVLAQKDHAVSRAYYKLKKAFEVFSLSAENRAVIDVGSSTGGFTQYLLERGARLVYAVDCGTNQLVYSLRRDSRVIVMEKTNARFLKRSDLENAYTKTLPREEHRAAHCGVGPPPPPLPDLAVIDVSFISSTLILPQLVRELSLQEIVLLVKPQFEASRKETRHSGVVRGPLVHAAVLRRIAAHAGELSYPLAALDFSPVKGSEGNIEFLALLKKAGDASVISEADSLCALTKCSASLVERVVDAAHACL
jgi:23S rRNA (cytidine1920-2'-O)/16S rRNA (cytidine1409-2'-O)-methyltransferase